MKKREKVILAVFVLFGIVLVIAGLNIQMDYYSSCVIGAGIGVASSSIIQFIRIYHNTKPENIEAYQEKLRKQSVNLKDERLVFLRYHAAYIALIISICLCLFLGVLASLFRAGIIISFGLLGIAVCEIVILLLTYRCLCSKM